MKPASRIPMNYISLDLETTGFSAQNDRITEIGAVKVRDGKIVDRFTQLVNPGRRVSARITELTGISNEMLEDQPVIEDILGDFIHWMRMTVWWDITPNSISHSSLPMRNVCSATPHAFPCVPLTPCI